jgi:hypothetical protein
MILATEIRLLNNLWMNFHKKTIGCDLITNTSVHLPVRVIEGSSCHYNFKNYNYYCNANAWLIFEYDMSLCHYFSMLLEPLGAEPSSSMSQREEICNPFSILCMWWVVCLCNLPTMYKKWAHNWSCMFIFFPKLLKGLWWNLLFMTPH